MSSVPPTTSPPTGQDHGLSLAARVLIGLVLGLGAGIGLAATGTPRLTSILAVVEPVGTLWVNAIRMTVVPLVAASIVAGVAAAPDPRTIGRVGGRAVVFIVTALLGAAAFTVLVSPPLLALLPIAPEAAEALRASAASTADATAESARSLPGFADWLLGLVPTNPIRAAADGAILPLIVFSMALGIAATRLAPGRRENFVGFFQALGDAMVTLVRWVLAAAPVGVFALALPLAARLGIAAAGAVAYYITLTAALCLSAIGVLYPVAAALGRVPIRRFARAAAPAQAVALSSRSSLASLPAMIEGAEAHLRAPSEISRFFLPLAASTFRISAPIVQCLGALFIARLYGIEIGAPGLATIALVSVATSFSVPGIPGGGVIVMVPVLLAVGLPVEGVGILLGVDTIPDMIRTAANVTADMAGATILGRRMPVMTAVPATPVMSGLHANSAADATGPEAGTARER